MAHLTETGRQQLQHTDIPLVPPASTSATGRQQLQFTTRVLDIAHLTAPVQAGRVLNGIVRTVDMRLGAVPAWNTWGTISGVVVGAGEFPRSREVRVYDRDTRQLVGWAVSGPEDGAYSIRTPLVGRMHVAMQMPSLSNPDDDENAQVYDQVVP